VKAMSGKPGLTAETENQNQEPDYEIVSSEPSEKKLLAEKIIAKLKEKLKISIPESFVEQVELMIDVLKSCNPLATEEYVFEHIEADFKRGIETGNISFTVPDTENLISSDKVIPSKTELETRKEPEKEPLEKTMPKKDSITVSVETENHTAQVYQWAIKLSGEEDNSLPYVPTEWFKIFKKLQLAQGILLKVVGAQGIGKTTMADFLKGGLNQKTTRLIRMMKGFEPFGRFTPFRYIDTIEDDEEKKNRKVIVTEKDWEWNFSDDVLNVIVDMWDYSKSSQKDIVKALDAIQDYWIHRCNEHKRNKTPLVNIVIFLQKEALPLHFFLGKMELFELEPVEPRYLVSHFKELFKTLEPFTEDALTEIAYCSQGNFRNFKKYIATCIELLFDYGRENKTITIEDVKKTITAEKLSKDMELQLSEIYPRSLENRVSSVKVIRFLRENGATKQKILTKQFFNDNKLVCSRLLNTLQTHGYLSFEDDGKERIWKVAEVKP